MTVAGPLWRTTGTGKVVDEDAFAQLLDLELQKARRLAYCVSIVSIGIDAPTRPHGSLGTLAGIVAANVRATDLVTVIPARFLALLLVDAPLTSLQSIVWRLALLTGLSETLTVWSAGASCYPETRRRREDLLRQARDLMLRAAADGGNRLYLP